MVIVTSVSTAGRRWAVVNNTSTAGRRRAVVEKVQLQTVGGLRLKTLRLLVAGGRRLKIVLAVDRRVTVEHPQRRRVILPAFGVMVRRPRKGSG